MIWRLLLGFALAIVVLMGEQFIREAAEERRLDAAFRKADHYQQKIDLADVDFTVRRDWGTGMEAGFALKNTGWKTLHGWTLMVEFPRDISRLKGAQLTAQAGTKYRLDAPGGWNSRIPAGKTLNLAFRARPGGFARIPSRIICRGWTYPTTSGRFNYAEVLQKSLYFYEAQRSGKLPETNRVHWRGDSALGDGADVGVDLSGGYYDAGDHVKFGLPLFSSLTLLSWSGIQYGAGYKDCGEWERLLDTVRWGTDWVIKAHTKPDELYGQVGEGQVDHDYWGPPEQMAMPRPAFKIDASQPGSELAAEAAAALAAASLLFAKDDPDYSRKLIEHAVQLFDFADKHRGKYTASIKDAGMFYDSESGFEDELVWAAAWLYRATGRQEYLKKAEAGYERSLKGTLFSWTHTWDDKRYGAAVLLAQITRREVYKNDVERFLNYWTVGHNDQRVPYTPGGLAWIQGWGALRYTANTAFLAFIYSDTVSDFGNVYHAFAKRQINYILGDNPAKRSYVVGFGENPPRNPHHRAAHGSTENSIDAPTMNLNVLYGALVGGPFLPDDFAFSDNRRDERSNEIALDYNAAFTGALARMVMLYGGRPLKQLPP